MIQQYKKPTNCQVQLKYHTMTEPRRADPLPGVKEDQMMGPKVFSAMDLPSATFSERMGRERGIAADVVACSTALRSYLCLSSFGLRPNWRWLCEIGSTVQSFVGSFVFWAQWTYHCSIFNTGCQVIPWTEQTQSNTRLNPNDLRIPRPESLLWQFPTRHFLSRGDSEEKLSCSSPCELWTHFFTFSPELCTLNAKR